ncbi:MAG: glycerophosphoryl diester phosphodiesterase [Motiliproteus sp.]|jgi:glycerophosphoryl diester phosphodiesterase
MPPFELIGHRGYPARYPENTLLGFEQAIAAGARYLECDVQLSNDGIPFVFHDDTLTRLCGVDGAIHELSAEQLERCSPSAPEQLGDRFQGIPMLRLESLVALLRQQPQVTLFLELKQAVMHTPAAALGVARVLALIEEVRSQVVLISFSLKLLEHAQQQGWTRLAPVLTHWNESQQRSVLNLKPEWLFLDHLLIPPDLKCDSLHPPLAVYEVSDIDVARALAHRGVSWIETDSIGEMLAARDTL